MEDIQIMSLKSSTKTDVNTTELVISIDDEKFENAVEREYQRQKKNIHIDTSVPNKSIK